MFRTLSAGVCALLLTTAPARGEPEGSQKIEHLLNRLESASEYKVRIAAAMELGKVANGTLADWMVRALRRESNAAVRLATIYAIGQIPDHLILPPLLELVSEEILSEAEMIAVERIVWNYRTAVPKGIWTRALLDSREREERATAAYLLGLVGDLTVVPALEAATRDPVAYIRMRSTQAIGRIGARDGAAVCRRLTASDPDPSVRRAARLCTGEIDLALRRATPAASDRRVDLKIDLYGLEPNSMTPEFVRIYRKRNVNPRAIEQALALLKKSEAEERADRSFPLVRSETTRSTFRMKADLLTTHSFVQADLNRLRETVKENAGYVNECYLAALRSERTLSGDVTARFLVLDNGAVSTVEITDSTLRNPGVHACMIERIRRIRFPAVPLKYVAMRYTFTFVPPKDEKFEFGEASLSAEERRPGYRPKSEN